MRSFLVVFVGSAFASVASVACSTPAASVEERAAPVVRGRAVAPGEWTQVLHIGRKNAAGEVKYGCTGTLVTPRLVMTAAHCIEKEPPHQDCVRVKPPRPGGGSGPGIVEFRTVPFGVEFEPASAFVVKHPTAREGARAARIQVKNAWANPRFRDDLRGWADTALLELETPLEGVPIVPILTDPTEIHAALRVGREATIVGFGRTSLFDLEGESRTANVGEVTIRSVTSSEVELGGGSDVAGASPGDSGGPAFVKLANGEWRVFGVTSRGPENFSRSDVPSVFGVIRDSLCELQRVSGQTIAPGLSCSRGPSTDRSALPPAGRFQTICEDAKTGERFYVQLEDFSQPLDYDFPEE